MPLSAKKMFDTNAELLRFATAGSVDDGKSTFIGRLLYDSGGVYEDQLEAVEKTSQRQGKAGMDLSLVTDGLAAEREQGITIDVAYRYFGVPHRRFIIADVPGHEQYTRNMITGASTANAVIILVDATKGFSLQSKRHLLLATLVGIPHVLIAVNKMDLVGYRREIFEKIKSDIVNFSAKLNIRDLQFVPVSALNGDMVVQRCPNMAWYEGPTVLSYLSNLHIVSDQNLLDFRFPIQLVLRPRADFRGYAGRVAGGVVRPGDEVVILPSGSKTKIKSVIFDRREQSYAFNPQSVVLTLADEVDASRGNMVVRLNNLPEVANKMEAMIFWMSEEPLAKNKNYLIKHTTKITRGAIIELRYKINVDNLHREPADNLSFNDIGRVYMKTHEPLIFDPYNKNRNTGSFIIIDEFTNQTVGAGIIWDNL